MLYFCPATSATVPDHSVAPCGINLSISTFPLTVSLAPSSLRVKNVYVSDFCACTCPVHRTLNVSD
jgi:hypothetical protein